MTIPTKLRESIKQVLARHQTSRALRKLAGVRSSASEAQAVWPRILEHKWYLSERLGRDVGVRVAAVDYFENVQPPRRVISIRTKQDALPPRLPMMMPFGDRP